MIAIDSLEKRVLILEQRVKELEDRVAGTTSPQKVNLIGDKRNINNNMDMNQPIPTKSEQIRNEDPTQNQSPIQFQEPFITTTHTETKIKEAVVGKYLIGSLASLLIFVAAISLVGLVWNDLSSGMKLSLLTFAGIVLTVVGFYLIRKKKNPITAIILGTGSGLVFISVLAANMAFHLIGNNTTIILACFWCVFFILSSRYINMFFTTIIAYIGSYIALILGLSLLKGDMDLAVMTLFVTVVAAVMLYNAQNNKNRMERNISLALSYFSYSTILTRALFDGVVSDHIIFKYWFVQIGILLILYVLLNLQYRLCDVTKALPWHIVLAITTTILTGIFINYINDNYLHYDSRLTLYIWFFIINLVQLCLVNINLKNVCKVLTIFYAFILMIDMLFISDKLYQVPTGIAFVAALLILIELLFKKNNYHIMISIVAALDSLLLITTTASKLYAVSFGVLQLSVVGYVLYRRYTSKEFKYSNFIKSLAVVTILFDGFSITHSIGTFFEGKVVEIYSVSQAVGYMVMAIIFAVLFRSGFFKDWSEVKFRFFDTQYNITITRSMRIVFYCISTALYFIGLQGIGFSTLWYIQLIFTIATIIIALIQSYHLIINKSERAHISEVWIGLKYLIFTFVLIHSFCELSVDSVFYSVAGLMIAIASISLGFRFRLKNLRLYGLVLTIVMVGKFIIIDLGQENSITRIIALIFGGLICFGISVIYNRLNNRI